MKCEICNDNYFINSNDEDRNDEIQKCDDCGYFLSDKEAQNYVLMAEGLIGGVK